MTFPCQRLIIWRVKIKWNKLVPIVVQDSNFVRYTYNNTCSRAICRTYGDGSTRRSQDHAIQGRDFRRVRKRVNRSPGGAGKVSNNTGREAKNSQHHCRSNQYTRAREKIWIHTSIFDWPLLPRSLERRSVRPKDIDLRRNVNDSWQMLWWRRYKRALRYSKR